MNPDAPFTITVTANDSNNVKEEEYARWQTQNSPCFPRPLCVSLPPKPPARQQSMATAAAAAAAAATQCSAQDSSPSATIKTRGHDSPCRAPPARITRPNKMSAHSHLLLRVAQNAKNANTHHTPANRIQLNNQMDNLSPLQSSLSPKRPIRQKSVDVDIALSNSMVSESQHSMEFPVLEVDNDDETASSFSSSSSDDDDDDDDSCVSSSSSSSSSCSIRREHSNNDLQDSRDLSPARPERQKTMTFVEYGLESQASLELVCAFSQRQDSRTKHSSSSQNLNDSKDSLPAPPRRQKSATVDCQSELHDSQQSLELLALDDKDWLDSQNLYPARVPRCQEKQQGGHDSSRDLSPSVPRRQQTVTVSQNNHKQNPLELPLNMHDSDSRDLSPPRPCRQKTVASLDLEDEDDDELLLVDDLDGMTTSQMMAAIRMLAPPPRSTADASSLNSVPPGRKPSWVKLWESQGEANLLSAITNNTGLSPKRNFWDME